MRNKWWEQDKAGDDKAGAGGGAAAAGEGAGAAGAGAGAAGAGGAGAAAGAAAAGAGAAAGGDAKAFTWGDGWREHLAAGDDKARARLERFQTPTDIFKSYRALEQRVSSGELKANLPFPDKGTDEEKAAWRKDAGIPTSPRLRPQVRRRLRGRRRRQADGRELPQAPRTSGTWRRTP
jgi:hypothetical protein